MVCHGFDKRGFRGLPLYRQLARKACEGGYASLAIDFRGCGESTGKFDYGIGEQQDLRSAIDYLASRREVLSDSIFVVGHSLGGAVALYATQGDGRVKGLALWATPHDHAYNVKKFITRNRGRLSYYVFLLSSYIDTIVDTSRLFHLEVYGISLRPRYVREKMMRLNESEVVSKLNVPILVVVGSDDKFVSVEETKILFSAAEEPKQLLIIPSVGHAFQGKEDEVINKTIAWFDKLKNKSLNSAYLVPICRIYGTRVELRVSHKHVNSQRRTNDINGAKFL